MFLEDPQTSFLSRLVETFKAMLRNESTDRIHAVYDFVYAVYDFVYAVYALVKLYTVVYVPVYHGRNSLRNVYFTTGMKKAIPVCQSQGF